MGEKQHVLELIRGPTGKLLECSELDFRPHSEFKKQDMDDRQNLYLHLAEQIWAPGQLTIEAGE